MKRYFRRPLLALSLGFVVLAVASMAASAKSTIAPRPTAEPKISGTKEVGRTLTVSNGKWENKPTRFTYQWYRCNNPGKTSCAPVPGATENKYRLGGDDAGHTFYASVTACNADGCATASSDAVGPIASASAPANTAAPTISGTPRAGQVLTASAGTWANAPTSFAYQWLRCDAAGNNCGGIGGATGKTYTAAGADVGGTLRVRVTAKNGRGSSSATSAATAVVAGAAGAGGAIPVSQVSLPDRLVVSNVTFNPSVLPSRAPFVARFRVTDTRGRAISGALVYVLGLPYDRLRAAPEVPTGSDGWATMTLSPTSRVPRRSAIVIFVRARKPGDNLLAGVSTRRLVQVRVRIA